MTDVKLNELDWTLLDDTEACQCPCHVPWWATAVL